YSHAQISLRLLIYYTSLMKLPPPTPTLFPYTTLFRSRINGNVRLSWNANENMSLAKTFKTGGLAFDVRLEAFNVFNRVVWGAPVDRKSTRLNSSHDQISYAVFCLNKKTRHHPHWRGLH